MLEVQHMWGPRPDMPLTSSSSGPATTKSTDRVSGKYILFTFLKSVTNLSLPPFHPQRLGKGKNRHLKHLLPTYK